MYRDLNDYEIIYMINEQKDDIFNLLYEKYKPLINKYAGKFYNTFKKYGYEYEDLMQLGYITLYKASRLYNSYNSSMFYTYLDRALQNAYENEYRNNSTNKKEVLNQAYSYDAPIGETKKTYEEVFPDKKKVYDEEYYNILIHFKNSMSFIMGCVFELYYSGYKQEEISVLLDEKLDNIKKYLRAIKRHALTYRYLFFK